MSSTLTQQTFRDIVNFLIPHCADPASRKALATTALFGCKVLDQLDYAGNAREYVVQFVTTLLTFGECHKNQPAIVAVLEEVKDAVGISQQEQINALIARIPHDSIVTPQEGWQVPESQSKAHIFISYSRENVADVRRVTTDLLNAGMHIWIDHTGLKAGTLDWEQALRDAIEGASAVLYMASPTARRSAYVRDELAIAQAKHKAIFPVWITGEERTDCVPMGLGYVQLVDVRADNYAAGLQQLIEALSNQAVQQKPSIEIPSVQQATIEVGNPPRNPYKGLRAFRAEDVADFFGRDALIEALIHTLGNGIKPPRLLAVLGASGSGKSSVVMAGLLPQLRNGIIKGSQQWLYLDPIVPGIHPIESLTIALARLMKDKSQTAIREDLMNHNKRGLHALARELSDNPIVLYIDQFEELFTLVNDETERRQFLDLLSTAITEPNGVMIVILSMRADFYDRPMEYAEFGSLIENNHIAVKPMSLADLYDVVQKPAQLADVGITFDEGLVTEMVFAVREEIAALPLLQFTLDQLFERRSGRTLTLHAYQEMGGIQGALAKHAEDTYASLPTDNHRRLARVLFMRLIEVGEVEQDTTRRRATTNELTLSRGDDTQVLQETAQAFIDARLLVSDQSDDERIVEVSHEALIREWQLLQNWIAEDRDILRLYRRFASAARDWRDSGFDADFLARGAPLEQYQNLVDVAHFQLSALENEFLEASNDDQRQLAEREERRKQEEAELRERAQNRLRIAIGLLPLLLVLVGLSFFALSGQSGLQVEIAELVEEQTQVAHVRLELERERDSYATISALRESVPVAETPVASNTLEEQLLAIQHQWSNNDRDAAIANILDLLDSETPNAAVVTTLRQFAVAPVIKDISPPNTVRMLALSTDGRVALLSDGSLMATASQQVFRQLSIQDSNLPLELTELAGGSFSGDNQYVVTAVKSADANANLPRIAVWHVASGTRIAEFTRHRSEVTATALNGDGSLVATVSCSLDEVAAACTRTEIVLWDIATAQPVTAFDTDYRYRSIAFLGDSQLLTHTATGQVIIWDLATQLIAHQLDAVNVTAWSIDGDRVVVGTDTGAVLRWDYRNNDHLEPLHQLDEMPLIALDVSDDGQALLTIDTTGAAAYYNLVHQQGYEENVFRYLPVDPLRTVLGQITQDNVGAGYRIALTSGAVLRIIQFYDTSRTVTYTPPDSVMGRLDSIHFSEDRGHVAGKYVSETEIIYVVWTVGNPQAVHQFTAPSASSLYLMDGGNSALLTDAATIQRLDLTTGTQQWIYAGSTQPFVDVVFLPDEAIAFTKSAADVIEAHRINLEDGTLLALTRVAEGQQFVGGIYENAGEQIPIIVLIDNTAISLIDTQGKLLDSAVVDSHPVSFQLSVDGHRIAFTSSALPTQLQIYDFETDTLRDLQKLSLAEFQEFGFSHPLTSAENFQTVTYFTGVNLQEIVGGLLPDQHYYALREDNRFITERYLTLDDILWLLAEAYPIGTNQYSQMQSRHSVVQQGVYSTLTASAPDNLAITQAYTYLTATGVALQPITNRHAPVMTQQALEQQVVFEATRFAVGTDMPTFTPSPTFTPFPGFTPYPTETFLPEVATNIAPTIHALETVTAQYRGTPTVVYRGTITTTGNGEITANSRDAWGYVGRAGESITVHITGMDGFDPVLTIFQTRPYALLVRTDDIVYRENTDAEATVHLTLTGVYHIEVSSADSRSGSYQISITVGSEQHGN